MLINKNDIQIIVDQIGSKKHNLIAVLQALQEKYKYLPKEVLKILSEISESTPAQINGVVSFYSQFRTEEIGENLIKVCDGTACHIKGSDLIHKAFHRILNIAAGKDTDPSKKYTVEKVACLGCCTIAPVVQINNTTYGHISSDKVDLILQDFENQKDKNKTIFKDNNGNEIDGEIRIGLGSCCVASGSLDIKNELNQSISKSKLNIDIKSVGCVGMCHQVPMVEVIPKNKSPKIYSKVQPEEIESILNKHFKSTNIFHRFKNNLIKNLKSVQDDSSWDGVERFELDLREKHISQFLNKQYPIATLNRGVLNPLDIEEYISLGGFEALKKAIKMTPDDVLNEIRNSQIRGRGGAGFHSWKKWKIVKDAKSAEKYLICNGDEGDPGAFMDRMILESYPFRVIEGMLIAAYTCGISKAFFYIRDEYKLAVERINYAIDICKEENLIGKNILNSDFSIDFKIEKDCQKLFALNQPVALDLRLVISAINLSTDLERIGDISVNIAELFLKTKKKPIFLDKIKYKEMVNEASQMLKNSLDAFIGNDVEKAKLVIISDKLLDDLNHVNDQLLIDIMKNDPNCIDHAVHYLDICHQIERCGDHSTNIAEDVYFIAEADIIKHKYEKYIFTDEDNDEDEDDKD